jgi:serine protease Do
MSNRPRTTSCLLRALAIAAAPAVLGPVFQPLSLLAPSLCGQAPERAAGAEKERPAGAVKAAEKVEKAEKAEKESVPAEGAVVETAPVRAVLDAPSAGPAAVQLRGGYRVEGSIVKRTEKILFLDIGFTILPIPVEEVSEVSALGAGTEDAASGQGEETHRDSIFYSGRLEPGTIEEKAREVAESVVQILCLGKSGSGFVVDDDDAYVVTNHHVIEQEQNISVVFFLKEHRGFRRVKKEAVRIIALNPFFDLALLKIEDTKDIRLRPAYLGAYARVRVGDPVFAIGSPLGLDRTVSEGIVSNRSRAITGMLSIQTTAPINPGNSGGPLFNNRGEVVGVTNLKILGGENLGFAIPIHYVKDFLRNRDAYAYDKDNPNTGIRYLAPPLKRSPAAPAGETAPEERGSGKESKP